MEFGMNFHIMGEKVTAMDAEISVENSTAVCFLMKLKKTDSFKIWVCKVKNH